MHKHNYSSAAEEIVMRNRVGICFKTFLLAALMALSASQACAQAYPNRPIRWIIADSAGGNVDILGRIVAEGLTQTLGQQVVVDNRTGAGGNIGADIAAKSPPDGYTMFMVATTQAVNVSLYKKLSYDLLRDFAPVTQVAVAPAVVVVHPAVPVKTLADLVKLAKAKPGKLQYASAGIGTSTFLAPALFKAIAGIDMLHVPYRGGGQALTAMVSGETSLYFSPVATALPFIREGKLRVLAVTTPKRLSLLPESPTIVESGYPAYSSNNWYGLLVPAGTPRQTIATLHKATLAVLNSQALSKRLNDLGFVVTTNTPEELAAFMKSEVQSLGKIMKQTGVVIE